MVWMQILTYCNPLLTDIKALKEAGRLAKDEIDFMTKVSKQKT